MPRIILVDHDKSTSWKVALERAGYSVLKATTPSSALAFLTSQNVDLVILGRIFPVVVMQWLIDMLRKTGTPVIAIYSGNPDPVLKATAYVNVADGPSALLSIVQSIAPGSSQG